MTQDLVQMADAFAAHAPMMNNNLRNDPLVLRAIEFASQAHSSIGQLRKYSGEPYIVHPIEVIDILLRFSSQEVTVEMLAAAACHDVVEDTPVTLDQVRSEFGDTVADLVDWLTDVSRPENGNRKVRKAIDLAHTAQAPVAAKNIKICDCVSNAPSITAHDPGFARKWLQEKAAILEACADADPALLAKAYQVLNECRASLASHTNK